MKRRRVTRSRSWGFQATDRTYVDFQSGWVAGAYVVVHKGYHVAQCTDKWMADMILASLLPGTPPESK